MNFKDSLGSFAIFRDFQRFFDAFFKLKMDEIKDLLTRIAIFKDFQRIWTPFLS